MSLATDRAELPHDVVDEGLRAIAAELTIWLPADVAMGEARNIAQSIVCGENARDAARSRLGRTLANEGFVTRVLAPIRAASAWRRALARRGFA